MHEQNKDNIIIDLLGRISNLEFDVERLQNELFKEIDNRNSLIIWLEDLYYGRNGHMDSDVIGIKDVIDKIRELKGGD